MTGVGTSDILGSPRQLPTRWNRPHGHRLLHCFHYGGGPWQAEELATALVESGVAACVSQMPGVRSTYQWNGRTEQAEEVVLMIKTTENAYPELVRDLEKMHSYELPEILAVPVEAGSSKYLDWIRESLGSKE